MKGFLPLFAVCGLTITTSAAEFQIDPWKPIYAGVELTRGSRETANGPEKAVALRIDLKADGLEFVATEGNGETPLDTDGETGTQFLKRKKVQIAVNTAFFTPCCRYLGSEPLDLIGYAVSQGEKISVWRKARPVAMVLSREGKISFIRSEPQNLGNVWFACAGMEVLRNGKPATQQNDNRHPRTAAGATRDGRYLVIAVIDGRQPKHSIGVSLYDTAQWLLALGAHDGINFDGGGSSILAVEGGLTGARVLNQLSSGLPRVNGAHLGIRAKPLP